MEDMCRSYLTFEKERNLHALAKEQNVSPANVKIPQVEVTHLKRLRKGEKIYWTSSNGEHEITYRNNAMVPKVLDIQPGEAVLFRQDLPHAGSGYERENLRIHAAFDFKRKRKYYF